MSRQKLFPRNGSHPEAIDRGDRPPSGVSQRQRERVWRSRSRWSEANAQERSSSRKQRDPTPRERKRKGPRDGGWGMGRSPIKKKEAVKGRVEQRRVKSEAPAVGDALRKTNLGVEIAVARS